jgi:hypothetical protein
MYFILKAIYVSAITEYIDFVHRFYIFSLKVILYRYQLFYDYISNRL